MVHIECHSLDIEETKWVAQMIKSVIIQNLLFEIFSCPGNPRNCYKCRSITMKCVNYNFYNEIGSLILVLLDLICSHFGYMFFFITCSTSTTQLKIITAHYCALGMVEYAVIEFLFDGELVCVLGVNMYYCYSFYLDLTPMNGGWMGVSEFWERMSFDPCGVLFFTFSVLE